MDALDALLASGTDPIVVPLAGVDIKVKPILDWEGEALEAFMTARFNTWASTSLVNDLVVAEDGTRTGADNFAIWSSLKPTLRQIVEFAKALTAKSGGLDLGKSSASLS